PRPMDVGIGAEWRVWQVQDQRIVDLRPVGLTIVTEALADGVVVAGKIIANLFATTSGTDSDWVVKVIDVYPENYTDDPKMGGYQLMIAGDVFRGRYYKSWEKPEPIPANAPIKYQIAFPANDHTFKKGHRIMVQVQSTWVPIVDRNPQEYVPNIFKPTDRASTK